MTSKEKALALRKLGYSYAHISNKTGLSKSTLSYHLKNVAYKPNKETSRRINNARMHAARTKAQKKIDSYVLAKTGAKRDIGRISKRDLFMLGLGIYIGEGSKTQDIIRVVNTDYRVINVFIKWLCAMGFARENFSIRLHLYPDSDIEKARIYWASKTSLSLAQFQRPCIDTRMDKDRKRSGKHVYGTAHVTVRSNGKKELGVIFARRIGAWMEEVLR